MISHDANTRRKRSRRERNVVSASAPWLLPIIVAVAKHHLIIFILPTTTMTTMPLLLLLRFTLLAIVAVTTTTNAFTFSVSAAPPLHPNGHASSGSSSVKRQIFATPLQLFSSVSDVEDTSPGVSNQDDLNELKSDLIRCCTRESSKPMLDEVKSLVQQLEDAGEQLGIGQASSSSGLLSGEWELLYSPEDETRSSPFFWAFRKAFPDSSDQIFGITDAIPAPIKEVGPANQEIVLNEGDTTGNLVSRVKVATLGGLATSIMTTRASITGLVGIDGVRLQIDTTKPEDSTVLEKLGPLGQALSERAPPFPSGQALEQVVPGSSEVVMYTTYCDDTLRISRNEDKMDEPYVWRRKEFASSDMV